MNLLLIALTLFQAPHPPQVVSGAAVWPPHLALAYELMKAVPPADRRYQHKPTEVVFTDEGTAVCRADCSGLINRLLEKTYKLNANDFKQIFGKARPFARDYESAIEAERGFQMRRSLEDVRPGDILAVRYPEDNDNTGHTMLVAQTPKMSRQEGENSYWEVDILDSTSSPHGKSDSRWVEKGKHLQGLGSGTIVILRTATAGGFSYKYAWSTSKQSKFYGAPERSFAFGMFIPPVR